MTDAEKVEAAQEKLLGRLNKMARTGAGEWHRMVAAVAAYHCERGDWEYCNKFLFNMLGGKTAGK